MDPNYVTGFSDAAGSFTYSRSGRQIAMYYSIKSSDRATLEAIQTYFGGVGSLYAGYYRVTHRDDLAVIVEHFDAYPLRGKKRRSYAIWREMVQLKRAFRAPDRARLDELAEQLSAVR